MDIDFLPYQLKKEDINANAYVMFKFSSKGFCFAPKYYNGVAIPSENYIMLLGGKNDLDVSKWVATVNHEVMHFVLYYVGITEKSVSEALVRRLEDKI